MKDLSSKYQKLFSSNEHVNALSVDSVNHKPHPFCVGPKHIQRYFLDTSIGCAMWVNDEGAYTNGYKKGYHKCGLPFEEHTSDTVLFLQVKKNTTNRAIHQVFKDFDLQNLMIEDKIDGLAFVDGPEKFRVTD